MDCGDEGQKENTFVNTGQIGSAKEIIENALCR